MLWQVVLGREQAQIVGVLPSASRLRCILPARRRDKPRVPPVYSFGLGPVSSCCSRQKRQIGLPIVTEVRGRKHLDLFADETICIRLGALYAELHVLLKELVLPATNRSSIGGLSATMEEFLMAAEYIFAGGNYQCYPVRARHRTFEKLIRDNLDISAVPLVKMFSHLPIIIDPSHATRSPP